MDQAGFYDQLDNFCKIEASSVLDDLKTFVPDAGDSQIRAWSDSIKILIESAVNLQAQNHQLSNKSSIIFEYTIPLESRRIDAVLLLNGVVVVIESN